MKSIYVFSGPCGCGKTTLANAFARHLIRRKEKPQAYVVHGDDFHNGFAETDRPEKRAQPGFLRWPEILRFNWECILNVSRSALKRDLDVIVDYVVEDELPLLIDLARNEHARLFYVVLTASREELRRRLVSRGNPELIDRALELKDQLENAPENRNHLLDTGGKTPDELLIGWDISRFEILL